MGGENDSREAYQAKVSALGRAYADALLAADQAAAEIAIREAMEAGLDTAQIDDEIIAPALWHVGALWERGEISVADEHVATEISIRVLALQREAQRVARARGAYRVMLAAPPGELHVVALRMVDNLLRNAGYDVAMLGSDVPSEALATLIDRRPPNVVCMTSTMSEPADEVVAAIGALQRRWPSLGFVIGGTALASRVQPRPGIDVCRRVSDAVEAVDAMIRGGGRN
jgi:MerR family transcriptional regulator, light-induced transcriptional regulator